MTTLRRSTRWYEAIQGETTIAAGVTVFTVLTANMPTAVIRGSTVTRMILDIRVHPVSLTTFTEVFWGVCVVNNAAVASAAVPDPGIVDSTDWLVHGRLNTRSGNLSANAGDDRVMLDIRAQRVLRATTDRLILVYHNIIGGAGAGRSHFIRTLMKHPL